MNSIVRIKEPDKVRNALSLYPFGEIDLDVDIWISDERAIVLDHDGDIAIFEEYLPRVYTGHYFFKSRGKAARDLSIDMLLVIFTEYQAEAVRGLTPDEHRAAKWMARHLGFKDYGHVETSIGSCTLFVMTKKEFLDRYHHG